jgi:integrase
MAIIKKPKHKTISNIKSRPFDWIAKQMGHAATEMLIWAYSRLVPNMTRQDGSAFERMLLQSVTTNQTIEAAAF